MNLGKFLNLLTEAKKVEDINKTVSDKLPQEFLDKLASKMKPTKVGKFYDNEAMAIIKKMTEGEEFDEFIMLHPDIVYITLKKIKKGNSSFNAKAILDGGSGSKYWRNLYYGTSENKPEEVQPTGIKAARRVDLGSWFAFIPKTHYENAELKIIDYDKSADELRRLSSSMAKLDKSEAPSNTDEIPDNNWDDEEVSSRDKNNPRVNHWCVASSKKGFYKRYKQEVGQFIIFVKKGKNGSPEFSDRYLYFAGDRDRNIYYSDVEDYNFGEFADKFDVHKHADEVLDSRALEFITRFEKKFYKGEEKKDEKKEILARAARNKARGDIASGSVKVYSQKEKTFSKEVADKLRGGPRHLPDQVEMSQIVKKLSAPWLSKLESFRDLKDWSYEGVGSRNRIEMMYGVLSSNATRTLEENYGRIFVYTLKGTETGLAIGFKDGFGYYSTKEPYRYKRKDMMSNIVCSIAVGDMSEILHHGRRKSNDHPNDDGENVIDAWDDELLSSFFSSSSRIRGFGDETRVFKAMPVDGLIDTLKAMAEGRRYSAYETTQKTPAKFTVKVKENDVKKKVFPNLSNKVQELFDKEYYSVIESKKQEKEYEPYKKGNAYWFRSYRIKNKKTGDLFMVDSDGLVWKRTTESDEDEGWNQNTFRTIGHVTDKDIEEKINRTLSKRRL